MQIVVLAGAIVTDAAGKDVPASLLALQGRPLVDFQLDAFVASGARRIVLCVGPQGEEIETHVRRALDRGLMVAYSYAGSEPSGTGTALRRAYARLEAEFVVTDGERYLPFDYAAPLHDLQAHPSAMATACVCRRAPGSSRADLSLDGEWVTKYEKGSRAPELDHVDCGVVALRRAVLDDIADGAVWGIEALFRKLVRERKLRALVVPEPAYDVKSAENRVALLRHLEQLPASVPPV